MTDKSFKGIEMDNITLEKWNERKQNRQSWILATPTIVWLLVFFLVPYIIVTLYSFLTPNIYDINFSFSLDSYKAVFQPIYLRPFYLSFKLAFNTTVICLLLGYPVAYLMAKSSPKTKSFLLFLIIIPFWTNFIIRIFAWRIFISPAGMLNDVLLSINLISAPLRILRTDFAVILVMVYVYIPYMILPLYSSIEKIDFSLLDAAMDLGANRFTSFLSVTLPLSKEGILAGVVLVFIPALGAYIVPQIVGDQNSLYIGQVIAYKIKDIPRDWPLASALSLVLLSIVAIISGGFYYLWRKFSLNRIRS